MNQELQKLFDGIKQSCITQIAATSAWHHHEPTDLKFNNEKTLANLKDLILSEHRQNFLLWHVEDVARRLDVDDSVIANCKRDVDKYNQNRNNLIEQVDDCLNSLIMPFLPKDGSSRYNSETCGMIIDRLSILALKIYHMNEQLERLDVDENHIKSCQEKSLVLQQQHFDLEKSLFELLDDYINGTKSPMLYKQFKMYNDPTLNPQLYSPNK